MKRKNLITIDMDFKELKKLLKIPDDYKFIWATTIYDLDGYIKGVSLTYEQR